MDYKVQGKSKKKQTTSKSNSASRVDNKANTTS